MSEVVDSFPPPAHAKYDWRAWTDGQIHRCTRGVDFESTPHNFAHAATNWAERHDLSLRVCVKRDDVWVRFTPGRNVRQRGKAPGPPLAREVLRRVG
jgi:hypothetical protein